MAKLRFRFQTISVGDIDVHVRTLKDKQQYSDPDNLAENLGISSAQWALFGTVWPSSRILLEHVASLETEEISILEVGCGIGLTSLFLQQINRDITATDYHPEAERFLEYNADLNDNSSIPFVQSDWNEVSEELGDFDLIVGSDLLYEETHVEGIASFVDRHAKKIAQFILVDPGRGRHNKLQRKMEEKGFSCVMHKPKKTDFLEKDFKGRILTFDR